MAATPLAASATTWRSGSWLMMLATPVRSRAWSSTRSTRERCCVAVGAAAVMASAGNVHLRRQGRRLPREDDLGSVPRSRDNGERRADPFRALLHAGHAEPGRRAIACDAAAVVSHRQPKTDRLNRRRANRDPPRLGVTHGIGERLLRDADDFALDRVA